MEKFIRFVLLILVIFAVGYGFHYTWSIYIQEQNKLTKNSNAILNQSD